MITATQIKIEPKTRLHTTLHRLMRGLPYGDVVKIDFDGVRVDGRLYTFHREAGWIYVRTAKGGLAGRAPSVDRMTEEWARDVFSGAKARCLAE